jgi:hypothetical protein
MTALCDAEWRAMVGSETGGRVTAETGALSAETALHDDETIHETVVASSSSNNNNSIRDSKAVVVTVVVQIEMATGRSVRSG